MILSIRSSNSDVNFGGFLWMYSQNQINMHQIKEIATDEVNKWLKDSWLIGTTPFSRSLPRTARNTDYHKAVPLFVIRTPSIAEHDRVPRVGHEGESASKIDFLLHVVQSPDVHLRRLHTNVTANLGHPKDDPSWIGHQLTHRNPVVARIAEANPRNGNRKPKSKKIS